MLGRTLTFNKQELQKRFMFDIITNELTFYLVAETEADVNSSDSIAIRFKSQTVQVIHKQGTTAAKLEQSKYALLTDQTKAPTISQVYSLIFTPEF
ncbi:GRB2-associated-binding protein 2 [Cricetulus griseus]|nr:GRB2-associated-binding protein 2 [Cricetulus griseus]